MKGLPAKDWGAEKLSEQRKCEDRSNAEGVPIRHIYRSESLSIDFSWIQGTFTNRFYGLFYFRSHEFTEKT